MTHANPRSSRSHVQRRSDSGFSFIELLAYMAIAALLILAAIPQFSAYREKASVSLMQSDARNLASLIESEYAERQAYPAQRDVTLSSGSVRLDGRALKLSQADTRVVYATSEDTFVLILTNPERAPGSEVLFQSNNGGVQPTTRR